MQKLIALAVLGALANQAAGAVLAYESFDYDTVDNVGDDTADGDLVNNIPAVPGNQDWDQAGSNAIASPAILAGRSTRGTATNATPADAGRLVSPSTTSRCPGR